METIIKSASLSPWEPSILCLVIYAVLTGGLIFCLHLLAAWLGEKKYAFEKMRVYESGVIPTGTARLRYPIPFFLVAIFFLVFDVEGAFIFAWAVACERLGWAGWLQISFFITILLAGLLYIWRKGGLDWGAPPIKK